MTTTSYAVLGLLCVRPWSAYELTQQMKRSLQFIWPRAESGIYREPQKLVDLGYASVKDAPAGPRRTKLVYAATPAGRRALRRWLRAPSSAPQFESEAILKFFFADQGDLDSTRLALDGLASHASALEEAFRTITASYADGRGAFPERLHIGAVIGRFLYEYAIALGQWAAWASEHMDEWPTTGADAARLGHKVQQENAALARIAGRKGNIAS